MASVQDTDQPPKRKSLEQLDIPGSNQHQVERNRKRTKYVRFLRVFLPILGALVVLAIFIMQDRNEFADIRPIEEVAPQQWPLARALRGEVVEGFELFVRGRCLIVSAYPADLVAFGEAQAWAVLVYKEA